MKDVISRNTIKFYKNNNSNPEVKHMTQQPGDYNFCLKLHMQTVRVITALEPAKDTINTAVRPPKFYKFLLNQLVGCVASPLTTQNVC